MNFAFTIFSILSFGFGGVMSLAAFANPEKLANDGTPFRVLGYWYAAGTIFSAYNTWAW